MSRAQRNIALILGYLALVVLVDVTSDYRDEYAVYVLGGGALLLVLTSAGLYYWSRSYAAGFKIVSNDEE